MLKETIGTSIKFDIVPRINNIFLSIKLKAKNEKSAGLFRSNLAKVLYE